MGVTKLLKGASVQISATNEDDIDEDKIIEKLSKITSDYSFAKGIKEKPMSPVEEVSKPFHPSPVKIPSPAPMSPPPTPVVKEKPRSPQKIVSPFLNPPASSNEPEQSKSQNGNSNGTSNTDGGPSHVNKIRAMFNQNQTEPVSPEKIK